MGVDSSNSDENSREPWSVLICLSFNQYNVILRLANCRNSAKKCQDQKLAFESLEVAKPTLDIHK